MSRKRLADLTSTSTVVAAMASALGDRAAPASSGGEQLTFETTSCGGTWGVRRWEAGKTTRHNAAQWAGATDTPINEDLSEYLETLRARSEFEAARNPMVAGVIFTHVTDVVGQKGPTVQIEVDDEDYPEAQAEEYCDALELVVNRWLECPDAAGLRSGVEVIGGWLRLLWTQGDFFEQFVTGVKATEDPITLRLLAIAPRRLRTPLDQITNKNIVMGIERNSFGRPLRYHVEDEQRSDDFTLRGMNTFPVPADMMLHGFVQQEPDQARGVPWLASNLQEIADTRQFDTFVLDAARNAAARGVILTTNHPDAPYVEVNEEADLPRNSQSTAPPGWMATMVNPAQPQAHYVEYRKERHMGIGRPVSMPTLSVRADASDSSFSSAHFDSQSYARANGVVQQGVLGKGIRRCVMEVKREGELAALAGDRRVPQILARPPKRIKILLTGWPTRPHVDPNKVRKANETGLNSLQLSLHDCLAGDGMDFETHVRTLTREARELEAVEIRPGLTLLDLYLAQRRPPNDPIDAADGEGGDTKPAKKPAKEPTRKPVGAA